MIFTKIQKDIIKTVINSEVNFINTLEPGIEDLQEFLKDEYSPIEIECTILDLILRGIFEPYRYQSCLRFTGYFKRMETYKEFREESIYPKSIC